MNTDVLIVGAGPTGLALACQLIRYGVDFVIVDKNEGTTPHSKAIGVQARTLEIYEQIGLADELVSRGRITHKLRLFAGGKERGEAHLDELGKGMSKYPFVLIVAQERHEAMLYDFIQSRSKEVWWQTEMTGFSQNESGVTATIKHNDGRDEII